jgi:hypothetical protein
MSGALLLTHPLWAEEVSRYFYRIPVVAETIASSHRLPAIIHLTSESEIGPEQLDALAKQYAVAARCATLFAEKEGLSFQRPVLPSHVVVCRSTGSLSRNTGMPELESGRLVVARVDLVAGVVYLGRQDASDLYVELGKWLFYGLSCREAAGGRQLLALAERFARFCQGDD